MDQRSGFRFWDPHHADPSGLLPGHRGIDFAKNLPPASRCISISGISARARFCAKTKPPFLLAPNLGAVPEYRAALGGWRHAISAAMPLTPKQRHQLLLADRTRSGGWISAVIEHMLAADPAITPLDVEAALRDGAAHSYLIAGPGKSFRVVTRGMPATLTAIAAAGMSPDQNRQALAAPR